MTTRRRTKKQVLDLSDTLDNDFQIDSKIPKEDTIHQASDEPQEYNIPDFNPSNNLAVESDTGIMNKIELKECITDSQDSDNNVNNQSVEPLDDTQFNNAVESDPEYTYNNTQNYYATNTSYQPQDPVMNKTYDMLNTNDKQETSVSEDSKPELSREELMKKKIELLTKLNRMYTYPESCQLTMANTLDEMEIEYYRLNEQKQIQSAIKWQQRILLGVAKGIEWGNHKWDPCGLKLDGWSNVVAADIDQYTEIFEEMRDKYKDSIHVTPEIKLITLFLSSGLMFHISQQAAQKYSDEIPELSEVLKENPELQKQLINAAAEKAKTSIMKNQNLDSILHTAKQPEPAQTTFKPFTEAVQQSTVVVNHDEPQPQQESFKVNFDDLSINSLDL